MSNTKEKELSARDAIEAAFSYFNEFMEPKSFSNPLLQGVKYLDPDWKITIGFDLGQGNYKIVPFPPEREPRRLSSSFIISELNGELIEML